jgi:hypothetical protein
MSSEAPKRLKGILRKAGKVFSYLFAAFVLVNLLMWAVLLFYNEDVTKYFVARLNQQLNTRLEIDEVDLGFWKSFPEASIELKNVRMHHGKPYQGAGYLLRAEYVLFSFGWMDFIKGEYTAKAIVIENGDLNLLSDKSGNVNYDVIKKGVNDEGESFHFEIESLALRNIQLNLSLEKDSFFWQAGISNANASGAFGESQYDLSIDSEFHTRQLKSGSIKWIDEKSCELACRLKVNKEKGEYLFSEGDVQIAQTMIGIAGKIVLPEKGVEMDLRLEGKDLDIASFISLLPEEYSKYTNDYESNGRFYANASLKGLWTNDVNPSVKIDFGVSDGSVKYKPEDVQLTDVNLSGEFSNGQRRSLKTSMLKLKDFRFSMKGGLTQGNLLLSDFDEMLIDSRFTSELDLAEVATFFAEGQLKELEGKAKLDLKISGALAGFLNKQGFAKQRPDAEGSIVLTGVSFKIEGDTLGYRQVQSRIRFNRQDVFIEQLSGYAGNTDFKADGRFDNFFGYLLTSDQPLGIAAHVQSKGIFLDELVSKNSASADGRYNLKLSPRLVLNLNMRIERLTFRRFVAQGISGRFDLRSRILKASQVRFRTMEGTVMLDGMLDGNKPNNITIFCSGKLDKINVSMMFNQFENFGQKVITDSHLKGKLNADVSLIMHMDSMLVTDPRKLESTVFLELKEGRLVNFEPLNNLSKFISVEELSDVKFSTLSNTFEIKNDQILIPRMEITSSALDIFLSGNHGFDNVIDYHFQLTMSDLLSRKAKKAKKENEEFGEVMDDGLGRTQLFLSMSGPIDNPRISYDSKGAKEKIKSDVKEEKRLLKKLLNQEFGLFKKDTTLNSDKPEKKKKPAVILEFEE